jgi:hypothetical protein
MTDPTLTCPTCRTEIKLTESLAAPLIADTRQAPPLANSARATRAILLARRSRPPFLSAVALQGFQARSPCPLSSAACNKFAISRGVRSASR